MTITLNGTTGITDVNGTAAAPAITGTDTDSGMYFGTNTVGLSTGGTEAVSIDASQNVTLKNVIPSGSSAPTNGMFLPAANTVGFATNSTERARIDTNGTIIVGKTATTISTVGAFISAAGNITLSNAASTSAADGIDIYSTGAAAYRFYVQMSGQINATSTSIVAISDISLKENIRDLETGLTQILALQPRRFDWKEETQLGEKNVAGFIAQEVEQVLPELVYDYKYSDTETKKSVKMGDILPTLVKAIQEQQALITSLTDRIAALEAR